jgi:hypothetical protein
MQEQHTDWETVGPFEWRQEVCGREINRLIGLDRPLFRVFIRGPAGSVYADDIVWCVGREDILAVYYWEMIAVLDGHYHCCFSGKTFTF